MNTSLHNGTRRSTLLAAVLVCLFASWLRLPYVSEGLPYFYHEDEAHHFNRTAEMVKDGRFDPQYFHKPSLHFYLRMPALALGFLNAVRKGHIEKLRQIKTRDPYGIADYAFTASHPGIVKATRLVSSILSIGIVLLVFFITLELLPSISAALISGILTALSPPLLEHSARIGVDTVMTFFCLAASYAALRAYRRYSAKSLFVAAILSGLAVSSKYNAAPIAALPLVVLLARGTPSVKELAIALLVPVLSFFAASPYILVSIPLFLDHVAYEIWHYGVAGHVGHSETPGLPQMLFYTHWLADEAIGYTALCAGVAGLVWFWKQRPQEGTLLVLYPLVFFLLMSFQRANFTRNMISILPYVAIGAGVFFALCMQNRAPRGSLYRSVLAAVVVALCVQPLVLALKNRKALARTESRNTLLSWLDENPFKGQTALAGELWLPPQIYTRPGFARISEEKHPIRHFLSGFDRIVVGAHCPYFSTPPDYLTLEKSFDGSLEEQRIIENPAIKVFRFNEGQQLEAAAIAALNEDAYTLVLHFSDGTRLAEECRDSGANQALEQHCWINAKAYRVLFDAPASARGPHLVLQTEIMSPWEGQVVAFRAGDWFEEFRPSAGQWAQITIKVPLEALQKEKGLLVGLSEVDSPARRGINTDTRRLGLAIRNIRIS